MNPCYKLFHLTKDTKRLDLVNKAEFYLKNHFSPLNTPTIEISDIDQYYDFYNKNPNLKVYPFGYCPGNVKDFSKGWKFGELGIWASNYTAWKNFLGTDYDYLILIEDDIILNDTFYSLFESYTRELPEDWDILSLYVPPTKYSVVFDIKKKHICKAYQDWSTLCYVMNKRFINKLFEKPLIIRYPLDWFLFRQNFNSYCYKPTTENLPCYLVEIDSSFRNEEKRIALC